MLASSFYGQILPGSALHEHDLIWCNLQETKRQGRRVKAQGHLKRKAGRLDLLLTRHEDEDVSLRVTQVHSNGLLHSRIHIVLLGGLGKHSLHRESAARDAEHRDAAKEVGKFVCI